MMGSLPELKFSRVVRVEEGNPRILLSRKMLNGTPHGGLLLALKTPPFVLLAGYERPGKPDLQLMTSTTLRCRIKNHSLGRERRLEALAGLKAIRNALLDIENGRAVLDDFGPAGS
jgi:hypothetical protein